MSATIYYEPIKPKKHKHLEGVSAPSSFMDTLESVFGRRPPMNLTVDELPQLRAMAVMYGHEPNPFEELIILIEKYEAIHIWPEY